MKPIVNHSIEDPIDESRGHPERKVKYRNSFP
jgi:hypothetical protein